MTITCLPLAASSVTANDNAAVEPAAPSFTLGEEIDTAGASSSSAMVRVRFAGPVTRSSLTALPETMTVLSCSSFALSTAAIVTVPLLTVSPAAMVSVFAVLSAKSPSAAFVPAAAVIVTFVSAVHALSSFAVTVAVLSVPLSSMVEAERASVTTGGLTTVTWKSRTASSPSSSWTAHWNLDRARLPAGVPRTSCVVSSRPTPAGGSGVSV